MTEFQKTLKELGGKARITGRPAGFGKAPPGKAPPRGYPPDGGVRAYFPSGHSADAGFRTVDRAELGAYYADEKLKTLYSSLYVPAPRRAPEIWKDAERDLLDGIAAWFDPDGDAVPCPVGEFSSLAEFALKAAASGALSGPPRSSP